jgi:hypothetical protein
MVFSQRFCLSVSTSESPVYLISVDFHPDANLIRYQKHFYFFIEADNRSSFWYGLKAALFSQFSLLSAGLAAFSLAVVHDQANFLLFQLRRLLKWSCCGRLSADEQ